jgi:hypothetical protein
MDERLRIFLSSPGDVGPYLSIVLGDDEKGDAAKYIDEPQGEAEQ